MPFMPPSSTNQAALLPASTARAALAWLVEAGVDCAVDPAPRSWLQAPARAPARPAVATPAPPAVQPGPSLAGISSLSALDAAVASFAHPLNPGEDALPRLVHGPVGAPLLVLAETPLAPGSDAERLLHAMLAAIGLGPAAASFGHLVPWSVPGGRAPRDPEVAAFRPFLLHGLALARPALVLAMGKRPAQLAAAEEPLRGRWLSLCEIPAVATFAPAMLLSQPRLKAQAWADLQLLGERLSL